MTPIFFFFKQLITELTRSDVNGQRLTKTFFFFLGGGNPFQGHSDPIMVRDTLSSQDASTHKI